jgi:hypothetical protein
MLSTKEKLIDAFQALAEAIVGKIHQAYSVNYDYYDPSVGHDAMTFGLMVYKSKVHFLSQLEEEYEDVKILSRHPYFCMKVKNYRVSTYCAGRSDECDIEVAFPLNRTRAALITNHNEKQLKLPFPECEEPDDSQCEEVVLADIGNHENGLVQLFLGVPIKTNDEGRIIRWGTILPLWQNDGSLPLPKPSLSKRELSPVEEVHPPQITLRDKGQEESHESS